jgi:hypothetical protein
MTFLVALILSFYLGWIPSGSENFSLDKSPLTWYYIHNGKSVRLRTLFSNGLNYDWCDYGIDYDWFIQSIFISNPLLTSSLVIVHHSIIPMIVKTASSDNSDKRFGYGDDCLLILG